MMKNNNYKSIIYKAFGNSLERVPGKTLNSYEDMAAEKEQTPMSELNACRIESAIPMDECHRDQTRFDELLRKYCDLYDFAPVGYYTLDKKGCILETNTTGADLLGFEKVDLIQSRFSRFIAPEFQDVFYFHQKRVLVGTSRQRCELKFIRRDGTRFFAQLESIAVKDAAGDFTRHLSAVTDITDSKKKEELRRKTHDLSERVKELNCLYGISKLVENKDHSLAEILRGVVDLIPPSWQYPDITCARIILDGRTYQTDNFKETVWKQSSGIFIHKAQIGILEVFYLEEKPEIDEGPFLKDERGLINAIAEGLGHITERIHLEDSLKSAYDDLERKVDARTAELKRSNQQLQREMEERNRITEALRTTLDMLRENRERLIRCERLSALGEVAAKITHEIRNPMVTIGGFARRILKTNQLGETNKNYLTIIVEEIKRLEGILTDILFFAKPADPTCHMVALNSIVKNSLETLRFELEENDIYLAEHLDPQLPMLCLDENQIRRVLHNLIKNAMEAMPEGGSLNVSTRKNHNWEIVEIADTGVGIAETDLNRLFDAFYTNKTTGSGLGLTISAQIINNHGGAIEVFNREPKGTVFIVKLPLRSPANQLDGAKTVRYVDKPDAN